MFDWLSRKLLGSAAKAGELHLDPGTRDCLPPGAIPRSLLLQGDEPPPAAPGLRHVRGGERGAAARAPGSDAIGSPCEDAKVVRLPVRTRVGIDRTPARRPVRASEPKTNS